MGRLPWTLARWIRRRLRKCLRHSSKKRCLYSGKAQRQRAKEKRASREVGTPRQEAKTKAERSWAIVGSATSPGIEHRIADPGEVRVETPRALMEMRKIKKMRRKKMKAKASACSAWAACHTRTPPKMKISTHPSPRSMRLTASPRTRTRTMIRTMSRISSQSSRRSWNRSARSQRPIARSSQPIARRR